MIVEHLGKRRRNNDLDEALSVRHGLDAELGAVDVRELGAEAVAPPGHCGSGEKKQ